jgi:hypothetical protein
MLDQEINKILDENKISDLKSFLKKRHFLNNCNVLLVFLFYLVQTLGILVTTIGTAHNMKFIIWCGICLNALASLITIYEKININLMKNMFINIQAIKNNNYVDESAIIDLESLNETNKNKINK